MEHTGLFDWKINLVLKSKEFKWTCNLNCAQSVVNFLWCLSKPLKTVVVPGQVWIKSCHCQPGVQKQQVFLLKPKFQLMVYDFYSQISEVICGDANFMGSYWSFLEFMLWNSFIACSENKGFWFGILNDTHSRLFPAISLASFSLHLELPPLTELLFWSQSSNTFSSRRA